ncbi:protein naked cuticle homolog 2-like protein [Lates japonicus]|uniref:Protein naked cuticle homolog 2-like protein n=1 Tax=Lates japonicus TaxID=270547 RepID=A0AAD3RCL3_LATJO|nr:protein naked cuticle homolog 2-like protein [Lates japonicus]
MRLAVEGQHYCVDENTERRNHYLDLIGIENYTSRFEGTTAAFPPRNLMVEAPEPEPKLPAQEPETQVIHLSKPQIIVTATTLQESPSKQGHAVPQIA